MNKELRYSHSVCQGNDHMTERTVLLQREALQALALDVSRDVQFLAIRTSPGRGKALAEALAECLKERIVGVIAGRDTDLVIARDDSVGREDLQEVQSLYA
jgi:arginine repressor